MLRPIKNVQGKKSSDQNWMVVEKGRGSEFSSFFADVINEGPIVYRSIFKAL